MKSTNPLVPSQYIDSFQTLIINEMWIRLHKVTPYLSNDETMMISILNEAIPQ